MRHLPKDHLLKSKYRIIRMIGQGGFGITYEAEWNDVRYAIKELFFKGYQYRDEVSSRIFLTDETQRNDFDKIKNSFLKESKILSKFKEDPGVIKLIDYFEENGTAYIVMDFIEGITLKERVGQYGVYKPEELFKAMLPLMETLSKIHKKGVIHRDISPDNIIVTQEAELILVDFGSSRIYDSTTKSAMTNIYKEGYSPAEQYGESKEQGPWSDVYALAATMYYCLTLMRPVSAISRLMYDDLSSPSQLGRDMAPALEKILMKGLEVEREKRYRDFSEMMEDINQTGIQIRRKNLLWWPLLPAAVALFALGIFLGQNTVKDAKQSSEDPIGILMKSMENEDLTEQEIAQIAKNPNLNTENFFTTYYLRENKDPIGYDLSAQNLTYKKNINRLCDVLNAECTDYILWKSLYVPITDQDLEGKTQEDIVQLVYEICARNGCIFKEDTVNQYYQKKGWYSGKQSFADMMDDENPENYAVSNTNLGFLINYLKKNFQYDFDESTLLGCEKADFAQIYEIPEEFPYIYDWYLTDADLENMSYDQLKNMKTEILAAAGYTFVDVDTQKSVEDYQWYENEGEPFACTHMLSYVNYGDYTSRLLADNILNYNIRLLTKHMIKKGPHDKKLLEKDIVHQKIQTEDIKKKTEYDKVIMAEELNLQRGFYFMNYYCNQPRMEDGTFSEFSEFLLDEEVADYYLCQIDQKEYQKYLEKNLGKLYQNFYAYKIDWNSDQLNLLLENYYTLAAPLEKDIFGATSLITRDWIYNQSDLSIKPELYQYSLKKQAYIFPKSNKEIIESEQIEALNYYEKKLARAELLARHGVIFQDQDIQSYFDTKSWYQRKQKEEEFDLNKFNDYEKENARMFQEYLEEDGE